MTGRDTPKRKNAREDFRRITDAEAVAQELELTIQALRRTVAKLVPALEAECDASEAAQPHQFDPSDAAMQETLNLLGRIKGRMYLERVMRGLTAKDISAGTGWSEHTLRQFEQRESDAMVSSLFRYAAGLRSAGIQGHLEIRWVPGPAREQQRKDAA